MPYALTLPSDDYPPTSIPCTQFFGKTVILDTNGAQRRYTSYNENDLT